MDSFKKLDPQQQMKNPVMFVVEVGSILTTLLFIQALAGHGEAPAGFILAVTLWLWFTVLFANFAEAMAEGRSNAQAAALRKAKRDIQAKKLTAVRSMVQSMTLVPGSGLRKDDVVLVEAGDFIPGDGEVIEGVASVDESAITGESAPVIRESGGDCSAVTGGTRVLSDWLVVRITANPGETFLDRMIGDGGRRQAPEDAQRDRADHPAGGVDARSSCLPPSRCCRSRCTASTVAKAGAPVTHHRAGRAAGVPDPDHHRRPAFRHRHRRHGPHDAEAM